MKLPHTKLMKTGALLLGKRQGSYELPAMTFSLTDQHNLVLHLFIFKAFYLIYTVIT